MVKKKLKITNLIILPLIFSTLFILIGVGMIVKGLVGYGINSRTLMVSGFGGHLLILIGIIFLIVTYFSLSPYSKIRNIDLNFLFKKKELKKVETNIRKLNKPKK